MPYELRSAGKGKKKVCKKNSKKCFSKKGMSSSKAKKQLGALHINTKESFNDAYNRIINENNNKADILLNMIVERINTASVSLNASATRRIAIKELQNLGIKLTAVAEVLPKI